MSPLLPASCGREMRLRRCAARCLPRGIGAKARPASQSGLAPSRLWGKAWMGASWAAARLKLRFCTRLPPSPPSPSGGRGKKKALRARLAGRIVSPASQGCLAPSHLRGKAGMGASWAVACLKRRFCARKPPSQPSPSGGRGKKKALRLALQLVLVPRGG